MKYFFIGWQSYISFPSADTSLKTLTCKPVFSVIIVFSSPTLVSHTSNHSVNRSVSLEYEQATLKYVLTFSWSSHRSVAPGGILMSVKTQSSSKLDPAYLIAMSISFSPSSLCTVSKSSFFLSIPLISLTVWPSSTSNRYLLPPKSTKTRMF